MNTIPSADPSATLEHALAQARATVLRHARLRLVMYAFYGLVTLAGFAVVADVLSTRGLAALVEAWPAALAQLGGAAVLVALARRQWQRVRAFRRRTLPVRDAVREELADAARQRRESTTLLVFAATAVPALLLAVQRLAASGAVDAAGARWLALACLLPGLVIAAVHGTRLHRLRVRGAQLQALSRELE